MVSFYQIRQKEVFLPQNRIFFGSDLEVVLRAQGITHLVLCGIATSGVVLSTLREAADKDYQLTVSSDACMGSDEEVRRVLLSKVFPRLLILIPQTPAPARIPGTRWPKE